MILTITLNPAVDKTVAVENFKAGSVNRVLSVRLDAGGKGINVSKVVLSLGGRSRAAGFLGGASGDFVKESLDRLGIENEFQRIEGETRTNLKIIDRVGKTTTDINEPGPEVSEEELEKLEQKVFGSLTENSVIVFSGSVPGNVDSGIYGKWIRKAKEFGARAVLDADGELLKQGIEAGPFLVKPNLHELERYYGRRIEDAAEAERLARRMIEDYGIEMAAVSMGEEGAVFINRECSVRAGGIKVEAKSTVGAGDSMVAALAYSIDAGLDFVRSARLAAATGTANVTTSGTQPAEYKTILELEKRVKLEYIFQRNFPA